VNGLLRLPNQPIFPRIHTAQEYPGYDALTQGSGFLNTVGAVRLAQFFATAQPGQRVPLQKMWSKTIIWGNHRLSGGMLNPTANAYTVGTTWGVSATDHGDNIVWGTACPTGCDNIVWGTGGGDNIVWGTDGDGEIERPADVRFMSSRSWRRLFRLTDEQIFTILRGITAVPHGAPALAPVTPVPAADAN
jgi:hypothetical protein